MFPPSFGGGFTCQIIHLSGEHETNFPVHSQLTVEKASSKSHRLTREGNLI